MDKIELDTGQSDDIPNRGVIPRVAHSMGICALSRTLEDKFTTDLSEGTASLLNVSEMINQIHAQRSLTLDFLEAS